MVNSEKCASKVAKWDRAVSCALLPKRAGADCTYNFPAKSTLKERVICMEVLASHLFCLPFEETDQEVGMLARFLVALGVLALLHSISSYLVPNLCNRGWRKTNNHVSPTIAFSSSPFSWNGGKTVGNTRSTQPVSAPRVSHQGESPPRHIILNDLKTGMQLEGVVVSSTPYAAFVNTGGF